MGFAVTQPRLLGKFSPTVENIRHRRRLMQEMSSRCHFLTRAREPRRVRGNVQVGSPANLLTSIDVTTYQDTCLALFPPREEDLRQGNGLRYATIKRHG